MGFDKKILDLSRTIYQTSVMVYGTKQNPKEHIENIRGMIREFIRTEVVPYELTNQEKLSFILKTVKPCEYITVPVNLTSTVSPTLNSVLVSTIPEYKTSTVSLSDFSGLICYKIICGSTTSISTLL